MANAISVLIHGNLETVAKYGNGETLTRLGVGCKLADNETIALDKGLVNKLVSDACSTVEAKAFLEALGKTGTAGKDSLTLGTGKIAFTDKRVTPAWGWAIRVNRLAKAMVANLEA